MYVYPQMYKQGKCKHEIRTGYLKTKTPRTIKNTSENQKELLETKHIIKIKDALGRWEDKTKEGKGFEVKREKRGKKIQRPIQKGQHLRNKYSSKRE